MKVLIIFLFCFTANANKIFKKKCASCHGNKAQGMFGRKAPKLAGQHAWYLSDQIKLIRDKKRTSGRSKTMYPFVKKLTDKEIKEVAKYLEGLDKKTGYTIIEDPDRLGLCGMVPDAPECTIELDDFVPSKIVSICDEEPKPPVCFL